MTKFPYEKRALITGICGQDGSYLAELLLEKGYVVHGNYRSKDGGQFELLNQLANDGADLHLNQLDLASPDFPAWLAEVTPHEIYHLGGPSHVGKSFTAPVDSFQEIAAPTLEILEYLRLQNPTCRLFNASSSEIFGPANTSPITEETLFQPSSPYGAAKAYCSHLVQIYRKAYQLYALNGILFNHESARRPASFVTMKIVLGAIAAREDENAILELGNLDTRRDWGYAPEYVQGMWLSLQQETAADCLFATGKPCSLRDFAKACYQEVGMDLEFQGSGTEETAIDTKTGQTRISVNPDYFRPVDQHVWQTEVSQTQSRLGWYPKLSGAKLAAHLIIEKNLG